MYFYFVIITSAVPITFSSDELINRGRGGGRPPGRSHDVSTTDRLIGKDKGGYILVESNIGRMGHPRNIVLQMSRDAETVRGLLQDEE